MRATPSASLSSLAPSRAISSTTPEAGGSDRPDLLATPTTAGIDTTDVLAAENTDLPSTPDPAQYTIPNTGLRAATETNDDDETAGGLLSWSTLPQRSTELNSNAVRFDTVVVPSPTNVVVPVLDNSPVVDKTSDVSDTAHPEPSSSSAGLRIGLGIAGGLLALLTLLACILMCIYRRKKSLRRTVQIVHGEPEEESKELNVSSGGEVGYLQHLGASGVRTASVPMTGDLPRLESQTTSVTISHSGTNNLEVSPANSTALQRPQERVRDDHLLDAVPELGERVFMAIALSTY